MAVVEVPAAVAMVPQTGRRWVQQAVVVTCLQLAFARTADLGALRLAAVVRAAARQGRRGIGRPYPVALRAVCKVSRLSPWACRTSPCAEYPPGFLAWQ